MDRLIKTQKIVVIAALSLTVAGVLASLFLFSKLTEASRWVRHTLEVQKASDELLNLLINAETGQRGFMLTNDPSYLKPYHLAIGGLATATLTIQTLTADNPSQQARLNEINQLIPAKLDELSKTIELSKNGRKDDALNLIEMNAGKASMDKIRLHLRAIENDEEKLLASRAKNADRLRRLLLSFIGLSLVGSSALAASVSRSFRDHFVALNDARQKLQMSNFQLQHLLQERTSDLAVEGQRVRVSDARQRVAVEAGNLGAWDFDLAIGKTSSTPRHDQIFGYEEDTAPDWTIDSYLAHVHPEDRDRIERLVTDGGTDAWNFECRIIRAGDETVRWVEFHGGPRFDERDELIGYVGVIGDVTDRKAREAQLDFVTKELAHRSKNMLSVIQAISRQTARYSSTVDGFEKAFSARIAGLSQSQDLLVGQNWRGAALANMINAHLAPFADRLRVKVDGPSVFLKPDAAQNLGFALHELATNASKYGALSGPRGTIAISWTVDGGAVKLRWQERDGPAVSPPDRKGFGNFVTGKMMEQTLTGKVELTFASDGVVWQIEFPATHTAA